MSFVSISPDADPGVLPDSWLVATKEAIMAEAAMHHGACDEGDLVPGDLEWQLVIDLPLITLIPLMTDFEGWKEWFAEELAMHDAEHPHQADAYRALMDEPLDTPVVITIEIDRIQIWDGWHRTATRILGGATVIPAIVGRLPSGPKIEDLIGLRAS